MCRLARRRPACSREVPDRCTPIGHLSRDTCSPLAPRESRLEKPVRGQLSQSYIASCPTGRGHGRAGFLSFRVGIHVVVVNAIAVGVSVVDQPRILEGVIVLACTVALNLPKVVLLGLFRVVDGLLSLALVVLGLQDFLFLGITRNVL